MIITIGKLYLLGAIVNLILLLIHAYFISYIVADPTAWFLFVTGMFLSIGLMGFIGAIINEIVEKRF